MILSSMRDELEKIALLPATIRRAIANRLAKADRSGIDTLVSRYAPHKELGDRLGRRNVLRKIRALNLRTRKRIPIVEARRKADLAAAAKLPKYEPPFFNIHSNRTPIYRKPRTWDPYEQNIGGGGLDEIVTYD
jgi:hypothetical protein